MKKIRIFEVATETGTDNRSWSHYNVAASTAEESITKAKKQFCTTIKERPLGDNMLAEEN